MPKIKDVKKVLLLGSGPIVIGQACEFDYSGTQACKALMNEGLEVVLVNSNPATIMTDPGVATTTYIEPLNIEFVEKIIAKERPDAMIPTLGGQTALNLGLELYDKGVLAKYGVKMLGTRPEVIRAGENREEFRGILDKVGAKYPASHMVRDFESGLKAVEELGLPIILRPNYTLGGGGGGIAYSAEEYKRMIQLALMESPTSEVLVEQSILGWKEFELEVMRDGDGTFVVVCSIENFDPCGVHTGDSITVAPQQTLTDKEYQDMRDEARKVIEAVGIETGGANIQFAVHPVTRERVVIEMNPRVSRSSALASKATGFPIAKIAALVSIGYRLNEITNDITKSTPCSYEPALDYVVTKIPRFSFEKFHGSQDLLTTQMKSVGEVMAIGRTFKESLQKAVLSLEKSPQGFPDIPLDPSLIASANSMRLFHVVQALREEATPESLADITKIDIWFLNQLADIVEAEKKLAETKKLDADSLLRMKRLGFSDARIGALIGKTEHEVRANRLTWKIRPAFLQVDTCAGEFESQTPYLYSTYWSAPKMHVKSPTGLPIVGIIGSGPNRIGQGIEFDYSCVRGVWAFQKLGYDVAMINSNPETVSTDYDTANELYFEPLQEENVLEVLDYVKAAGFVAQLGGQTPIGIAQRLVNEGHKLFGSSLESIDLSEDRGRFSELCRKMNLFVPQSGMAGTYVDAEKIAQRIGYPVLCRPNYVLGGRRMEVVETAKELESYFERHGTAIGAKNMLLIDQFLEGALEVDVDLVRAKDWAVIGGIVEHIEAAGVHSGDSMGVIPPQRLREETLGRIQDLSLELAKKLEVIGHLNLQLAIKDDVVFVLEANPRSSRSVPFIAKATGIPIVDLGVRAMLGLPLDKQYEWRRIPFISVKGVVFPFKKFPEADSILGPEMKSTGESMGRGQTYSEALFKAFVSSNQKFPKEGEVFFSLKDRDKLKLLPVIQEIKKLGFKFSATRGTATFLTENGFECEVLSKVHEGRPHCVDRIRSGQINFVVNTTSGRRAVQDSFLIRRSCLDYMIPCLTETDAAEAFVLAMKDYKTADLGVYPI
jgi:carbamoyl-phosphate synthase large subunit